MEVLDKERDGGLEAGICECETRGEEQISHPDEVQYSNFTAMMDKGEPK